MRRENYHPALCLIKLHLMEQLFPPKKTGLLAANQLFKAAPFTAAGMGEEGKKYVSFAFIGLV